MLLSNEKLKLDEDKAAKGICQKSIGKALNIIVKNHTYI